MIATRPARPGRHHRLGNRFVLGMLRSPAHRLLDPGLCEIRYRGRRTGARVALPVMYAKAGGRLVILVGDAPHKTWWRNFRTATPVEVRRAGRLGPGVARLVAPGEPGYVDAAAAYTRRHGLVPVPTDRLLVIDVTDPAG